MNREIKFRAWDILNKKMLNWGDIFDLPAWEIFPGTPEQRCYEIMQYTGIKDKNGKEIYEGDIVKTSYAIYKVEYYRGSYHLVRANDIYSGLLEWKEAEVIGNIYENEELLKNE